VRNHGAELESWLEHSPLISNVEPHQFFTIDGFDTVTTEYDINGQNGAMKLQIVKKAVSVEYMAIEIHVIDKAAVEEFWRNMEIQVIDDDDDDDDDDAGDVIDGDDGARSHSI
jgi:hypothetical protein